MLRNNNDQYVLVRLNFVEINSKSADINGNSSLAVDYTQTLNYNQRKIGTLKIIDIKIIKVTFIIFY